MQRKRALADRARIEQLESELATRALPLPQPPPSPACSERSSVSASRTSAAAAGGASPAALGGLLQRVDAGMDSVFDGVDSLLAWASPRRAAFARVAAEESAPMQLPPFDGGSG